MYRTSEPFRLSCACCSSPAGASAQVFIDTTDVGQTLADAAVIAPDPVRVIRGSLSSGTDVDLFALQISRPLTFSARVVGGGLIDTSLFLLDAEGDPVYLNDDAESGLTLRSALVADRFPAPLSAGLYYLGVSAGGYEPVNIVGQRLFAPFIFSPTETRGPADSLLFTSLGGYDNVFGGTLEGGNYTVLLSGAATPLVPIPEPATYGVVGALILLASLRLRRTRTSRT